MSKFLAFSKRKSNEVVNHFSLLNNSFNLKNEHSNSLGEKQEQKQGHFFTVYYRTGVSGVDPFFPRCLNFTITSTNFSAILILGSCLLVSRLQSNDAGVPGLLLRDFL